MFNILCDYEEVDLVVSAFELFKLAFVGVVVTVVVFVVTFEDCCEASETEPSSELESERQISKMRKEKHR